MTLKDRIRSDLEAKIFSGAWPPGKRNPNEERLADACSRMTVNKVLTDLASEGLIERRRNAGSFVARPVIQSAVLRIPEIKAEVVALGYAYDYELLSVARRGASKQDRELLGVSAKTELLELRCRHWASISALNADNETSKLLEIDTGAACLVVRRRTWRAGDIITHIETIFPGAQYQLNSHFTPLMR